MRTILGRKILLYRKPYTVIGVMPRDFEFPLMPGHLNQSELWVPLSLQPEEFKAGSAASWNFRMVGTIEARHQRRAGAERCGASARGDHARLSGPHAQSSYSRGGDAHCSKTRWSRRDPWWARFSLR